MRSKTQIKTMKILSHIAIATTVVLTLSACSHQESDAPSMGNMITFNASAPLSGRQVVTTNSLQEFKVWAFANGKPYMSDVHVGRTENGWSYAPSMYWPADAPLNFYSYSPSIKTATTSDDSNPDIPGFINGGKTDLLYAVNIGETRGGANATPVQINFRHALSQVRFQMRPRVAKPGEQALSVKVKALDLLGTNTEGSFNFPLASTTIGNQVSGEWTDQKAIANKNIYEGTEILNTDTPVELITSGYIFSIPQKLTKSEVSGNNYSGVYARVLCEIFDRNTGVKIWPEATDAVSDGAGYIYFPLNSNDQANSEWQIGKAYRYTLNIDVPATSNKIDFDVTVEEFPDFINS